MPGGYYEWPFFDPNDIEPPDYDDPDDFPIWRTNE